jgi:hypothetical protein
MNKERSEIIEKARAKRRRRDGTKTAKASSRKNASLADRAGGLTEKVIDLAQDAATQVGAFVKSAADTVKGVVHNKSTQVARRRSKKP